MAWGLIDQAISSATNFGASVLAARALTSAGFGSFAIAFSLYLIALGVSRAWTSEPLVVMFAGSPLSVQGDAIRSAGGLAVVIGAVVAAPTAIVGIVLGEDVGKALVVLAICLPGLLLQDACRLALIMIGRSRSAAGNDLVWLLVMLVLLFARRSPGLTPATAVGFWAASGSLAGLAGLRQLRSVPALAPAAWIRRSARLSWRYSTEFLLVTGTATALTIALAVLGGLSEAAGFRASQVLVGPLGVLGMGVTVQIVPVMVRRAEDRMAVARLARTTSVGLGTVAVGWMVLLLLLPQSIGSELVGDSWQAARPLVPIMAASYAVGGGTIGAMAGLRALGEAKASLRVRTLVAPLFVVLGFGGAAIAGPPGAASGLTLAAAIGAPVWWRTFLRRCR